jgi:hypothetical protein
VDQETVDAVGYGVEGRLDDRELPESLEFSLIGELDLEETAPMMVMPLPLDGALSEAGLDDGVAVRLDPGSR